MGWKTQVFADAEWVGNGVVWPDKASAECAGRDLLSRWTVPSAYRTVETTDKPNRPTWDEHVGINGLPPRRVQL